MARRVTVKGGPIHGISLLIPDTATSFTHHAAPGGRYRVTKTQATWKPEEASQEHTDPTG